MPNIVVPSSAWKVQGTLPKYRLLDTLLEWVCFAETDSTNTFLKTHAREEDAHPYVVAVADYQTGGRGQRGNSWESERGENLLFTMAHYEVPLKPTEQFFLSQYVALGTVEELRRVCPEEADNFRIKWPNDIYWRDKKIAGILIEHELSAVAIHRSLIGLGLNVNQTVFRSDAPNPVSLCQIARRQFDRADILCSWLASYMEGFQEFDESCRGCGKRTRQDFIDNISQRYHELLYRRGIAARYRDADGEFTATLEGVAEDGMLCLRDDAGRLRHYAFKEVAYII